MSDQTEHSDALDLDKPQRQPALNGAPERSWWHGLLAPVVLIALLILSGVFFLIGAAIFGMDNGVLARMGDSHFARGLITYLFAVVTIGTAVVLVVSALTSQISPAENERFQRGKEVLSLLLGVFGTIVGFYFGSELRENSGDADGQIQLTSPLLGDTELAAGTSTTVTAYVSGGVPPYRYGIGLGNEAEMQFSETVGGDGWIFAEIVAPPVTEDGSVVLSVGVRDAAGRIALSRKKFPVKGGSSNLTQNP